jgi:hypothetical protein
MPSIKKCGAPERIDLPSGWHFASQSDNLTSSYLSLCRPDGTHACSMHKKDARVFADAMNGIVRRLLRKLGLTSRKW